MYVLFFFSLLTILLTRLESKGQVKNGMAIGFVIMTVIAAIRFDYGNDYMNYFHTYNQIISADFTLSFEKLSYIFREPGWALINLLFKPFGEAGFFLMVAVLALFQNFVYYRFIKKYVPLEYRWFAVYIYLFNTSLYILNMSMLRQGLTITILIFCIPYILEKKWLKSILIFLAFSTVHSSAKFLLPFAFWGYLKFSTKPWLVPAIYGVVFAIFVVSKDILVQALSLMTSVGEMQEYADVYIKDTDENSFKLGLGFLINTIPFVASLFYLAKSNDCVHLKIIVALACVGTMISPFGQVAQMITRISIYSQAASIVSIPVVYYWLKPHMRKTLNGIYIAIMLYSYWVFFHSPIWVDHYYTYTTLFSS